MNVAFIDYDSSLFSEIRAKSLQNKNITIYHFVIPFAVNSGDYRVCTRSPKHIKLKRNYIYKTGLRYFLGNMLDVRKLVKEYDIDILHIFGMGNARFSLFSNAKKVIIENNGSDVLVIPEKRPLIIPYYKFCYSFSNAVVQDSFPTQKAGIKYGAREKNNEIIELGIDTDIFNPNVPPDDFRKVHNISKNTKIVFSPRSFKPLYNIDIIMQSIPDVLRKIDDIIFVFLGYVTVDSEQYVDLANKLGISDKVLFLNRVTQKELAHIYINSDVVISVPSSDSLPGSVHEAMACKTACIISDLKWYKYKFKDGVNVAAVPVRNYKALAEKTIKILNGSIVLDLDATYEIIQNTSTLEVCGKKLEKLYLNIMRD